MNQSLPANLEAERSILADILTRQAAYDEVSAQGLTENDF